MWILYSFLGAFFQAAEMAIKKKALQTRGVNNFIAFLAFTFAGLFLGGLLYFQTGRIWPETTLSPSFWQGIFWTVFLNLVAVYFLYKALDAADLSYLMPFMTLTSLSLIIPPAILLGELPSVSGFVGIIVVVIGALFMEITSVSEPDKKKSNRKGLLCFLITAACFTITPTATKIAVLESSALFSAFLIHILIGLSFIGLVIVFREQKRISEVMADSRRNSFLAAVVMAVLSIAIANGSVYKAMEMTEVSYVFAIKRTMPLFAFFIGYIYFKERKDVLTKLIATAIMVAGAVIITVFR